MKARGWVLVVVCLAILIGVGTYYGDRWLKVDQRARAFLMERISPLVDKDFSVEDVHVRVGSIRLRGVRTRLQGLSVTCYAREVRVGYSLFSFFRRGFDPGPVGQRILVVDPVFVFSAAQPRPQGEHAPSLSLGSRSLPLAKVGVRGGRVLVERLGETVPLIADLRGWVGLEREGWVSFRAEGQALSRKDNLLVWGSRDRVSGGHRIDIMLRDADLGLEDLVPLTAPLTVQRGLVNVNGRFEFGARVTGSGQLKIANLSAHLGNPDLRLESFSLLAELRGDSLVVSSGEGRLLETPLLLSGYLDLLPSPSVHLEAQVQRLDAATLAALSTWGSTAEVSGSGSLEITLEGPVREVRVRGAFASDGIRWDRSTVSEVRVQMERQRGGVRFEDFSARWAGGTLTGSGHLDLSAQDGPWLDAAVSMADVGLQEAVQPWMDGGVHGTVSAEVEARGPLKDPTWRAWFELDGLVLGRVRLGRQKGWARCQADELDVESAGSAGRLSARILSPWTEPKIEADVQVDSLVWKTQTLSEPVRFAGHADVRGDLSQLAVTGRSQVRLLGRSVPLSVHGDLADLGRDSAKAFLEVRADSVVVGGRSLQGRTTLVLDEGKVGARFVVTSEDTVASGHIVLRPKGQALDGSVALSGFPLPEELGRVLGEALRPRGLLNAKIALGGTLDQPRLSGSLAVQHGALGQVDSLDAGAIFDARPGGWTFSHGRVARAGEKLAAFEGRLEHRRHFEVEAWGEDVQASALWRALGRWRGGGRSASEGVSGSSSYRVAVWVNGDSSRVGLDLVLRDGALFGIGVDRGTATVGGDLDSLHVAQLHIEQDGRYRAALSGDILLPEEPLGAGPELDVSLDVEGDIPFLLGRVTRLDQIASGEGLLTCRLVGSWDSPEVASGRLSIEGGSLRGWHVTGDIEDVDARLTVAPGTDFVEIDHLTARVRGGKVSVSNAERVDTNGHALPVLRIEPLGLSLGVLTVETGRSGIELDIRSVMGDRGPGRVVFAGKNDQEQFYVGGPVKEPLVRGVWLISNTSFTFPLLETGSLSSGPASLLKSAEWDLDVEAKDNVRYFRDVSVSDLPIGGRVSVQFEIEKNRHVDFRGSLQRGTFYARGDLLSKRGAVTYLDTEFEVQEAGMTVDTRYRQLPTLYGRARTTVTDTLGVPTDIFLEIYSVDEVTDARKEKARWENLRFELRSSDPNDVSSQDILVKLGYSLGQSGERAVGVLSKAVDRHVVDPFLRTFERRLQRATGLDVVGFTPRVVDNLLLGTDRPWAPGVYPTAYLRLLQGTTFKLGKYVLNGNWFVSYSGELEATMDAYQREAWGLKHRLGLEYMLRANTRLQLEYDCDRLLGERDRRVSVLHYFAF